MTITKAATAVSMAAAALIMLPTIAPAADLGGECCADLEDRIAELEATTARKGNRKMSVTISGEVNQAWLWYDDGFTTDSGLIDNGSEIVIKGAGMIRPGANVGFLIDIDIDAATGIIETDKAFVSIGGEIGTLSLGTRDHASDGAGSATVANTEVAAELLTAFGASVPDGDTANLIRYDSPALGPLAISASWGEDDEWSAALTAATEAGGFRLVGSAGYFANDAGFDVILASAGIKHLQSGLFVQGAFARIDNATDVYHVQGGIERDFTGLGATTIFGEYGILDFGGPQMDGFGAGIVQALDGASTDLYLSYRTSDDAGITAIMGGARVKF